MTGAVAHELGVGVLGASSMVYRAVIADALHSVPGVRLVHEASRSGPCPESVHARVGTDEVRRSQTYEAVLADPAVDLVYLPLPNHLHEEWVLACAAAGKHVLCEKPLAIDAGSAQRMAEACRAAGVTLLEAYMSPFHPRSVAVQQAIEAGVVGQLLHGEARMSGVLASDNHRWQVANGGGALLDVGIYCLEPLLSAFGWTGTAPVAVAASSHTGGDGVDASTGALLDLGDGRTIQMWVSFEGPDQQRLQLTGTDGALIVEQRHATPDSRDDSYLLRGLDGTVKEVKTATGSCYEGLIEHVRDVVLDGASPLRPPSRSVAVAQLLDQVAAAAGHKRPFVGQR